MFGSWGEGQGDTSFMTLYNIEVYEWNDMMKWIIILNCGSYDPRSYECNFSNCVQSSLKISGLHRGLKLWPSDIRATLKPTEKNIRTQKWPAPNVSGFIAQLVIERRTGIARSQVQTPLKSWIFQASLRNCKNCIELHNCEDHSFTWLLKSVCI